MMTDTHRTELVRAPATPLAPDRAIHPLIASLRDGTLDPATIREMMALQREHEASEAKKAYTRALAALKGVLPTVIERDAKVDYDGSKGRVTYRHATLAGVMDAVTEHLTAHGFSLGWRTVVDGAKIRVTCALTHVEGHSEETSLEAGPESSGGKNAVQAIASTTTLLQRYTALALLGIATRDMKEPTGEAEKVAAPGDGVDAERNLLAVSALQKAGIDVAEVEAKLGRKAPAWTAADRERVRDILPRKAAKPRENQDGSLDVDPPKG